VDIYEKLRPGRSPQHLLKVGRVATAAVVVLGIIWIPVMERVSGGGLYQYLQNVQGYMAPPIAALFLLGLFWKRCNGAGAVWGLGGGFVLGMIKLTLQTFFGSGEGKLHDPALLAAIGDFNPYYATGVLFLLSGVIIVAASLATPAPPEDKVHGLTYGSIHHDAAAEIKASWDFGNKLMVFLILAGVVGMYVYFTVWLD
jgi:SSS family solute:Na+ symporter